MGNFFPNNTSKVTACIKPDQINLSDCLACSGCIDNSEKDNFKVDTSFLENKTQNYSFIISNYTKMSISSIYNHISFTSFEKSLIKFLKEYFNINKIVDTSYFKKSTESGISSECPAVVLYIERVFPSLIPQLSNQKTFQQISADFIKNVNIKNENHKIVSIMQCYDKMDETKRDNTEIDYYLGTKEFYEFLKDKFNPTEGIEYELLPWEMSYFQDIKEISGIENCMNYFNKLKNQQSEEFLELRICKGGCLYGPAQIKENINMIDPKNNQIPLEFITEKRQFIKPKKKTFKIEW